MIRIDKIQTAFAGSVGFRGGDETNQTSGSGLFYEDGSELVTVKNIKDCQPNPTITDEQLNTLLGNMQKTVILDVCNKVVEGRSDFITSLNLYPFEKSFDATVDKRGKFVGFAITPNLGNMVCKIPWVELSFDTTETFDIHLFNSNLSEPIQTKSVTTSAGESKIETLDWIIAPDTTYKGGKFYLGYFDTNTAKAYKKDHDLGSIKVATPYFYVEPVTLNGETTIDVESENYVSETHGLNIGVDVYSDYTELITRNKSMFYTAIQLQMHEKVLNLIKYSTRNNPDQRGLFDSVNFELFGNSKVGIEGVMTKLKSAINTIRKAFFYQPRIQRGTLR